MFWIIAELKGFLWTNKGTYSFFSFCSENGFHVFGNNFFFEKKKQVLCDLDFFLFCLMVT